MRTGDYYDRPIEELKLNIRQYNALKQTGIQSVGDLLDMAEHGIDALTAMRQIGKKAANDIYATLKEHGYDVTGGTSVSEQEALNAILQALVDQYGGKQVQEAFNDTEWSKQRDKESADEFKKWLGNPPYARTRRNFSFGDIHLSPEQAIEYMNKKHDE